MKIPSIASVACIIAAPLAFADNHSSGDPEGAWATQSKFMAVALRTASMATRCP